MGVRRHRPGPPRSMGRREAAPGQPEPERRRRPRQRRPPGRARSPPSRPPAAAGRIHFRRRRRRPIASGARGVKGRGPRPHRPPTGSGWRAPPRGTSPRASGPGCPAGRPRAAPAPRPGPALQGMHDRGRPRARRPLPAGGLRAGPRQRQGHGRSPTTSPLPDATTPVVGARGRGRRLLRPRRADSPGRGPRSGRQPLGVADGCGRGGDPRETLKSMWTQTRPRSH